MSCTDNGLAGITFGAAVRLMSAGFLVDTAHDCKLMQEGSLKLAIWRFCGFGLTERLTDHSRLTRIRQRCGAECLRAI